MQGLPGPNYQELYNDIEEQFKEYKREAQKTQQMLVEDVSLGLDWHAIDQPWCFIYYVVVAFITSTAKIT